MTAKEVVEQHAIFDGKPEFPPLSMAIYLMNHYAYGGTRKDLEEAKKDEDMADPKRYKVRLTLSYEEV